MSAQLDVLERFATREQLMLDLTLGHLPNKDDILKKYIGESRSYLSEMPRERLGSIAADFDLVVALNTQLTYAQKDKDKYSYAINAFQDNTNKAYAALQMRVGGSASAEHDRAVGEVNAWRKFSGKVMFKPVLNKRWVRILEMALNVPDSLPYFESGIDSLDIVRTCLAESIDVATAEVLYQAQKAEADER